MTAQIIQFIPRTEHLVKDKSDNAVMFVKVVTPPVDGVVEVHRQNGSVEIMPMSEVIGPPSWAKFSDDVQLPRDSSTDEYNEPPCA